MRSEKEDARLDRLMIDAYEGNDAPATTQAEAEVHSPLPWKVADVGEHSKTRVRVVAHAGVDAFSDKSINVGIAEMLDSWTAGDEDIHRRARANAAFIVKAVNTYATNQQRIAELEAALTDVTRELDETIDNMQRALRQCNNNLQDRVVPSLNAVTNARAVLNRGGGR